MQVYSKYLHFVGCQQFGLLSFFFVYTAMPETQFGRAEELPFTVVFFKCP